MVLIYGEESLKYKLNQSNIDNILTKDIEFCDSMSIYTFSKQGVDT